MLLGVLRVDGLEVHWRRRFVFDDGPDAAHDPVLGHRHVVCDHTHRPGLVLVVDPLIRRVRALHPPVLARQRLDQPDEAFLRSIELIRQTLRAGRFRRYAAPYVVVAATTAAVDPATAASRANRMRRYQPSTTSNGSSGRAPASGSITT